MRASLIAIVLMAGVSACASDATGNRYQQDLDRLKTDCRARGGILASSGAQTGRPETDNICKITGGASRID